MTSRSRRQTRQRRSDGWAPEWHNEGVRLRKEHIRHWKEHEDKRRARLRAGRGYQAALVFVDESIAFETELQRQIAQADLMASLGWDMRDEHEALERGELIE